MPLATFSFFFFGGFFFFELILAVLKPKKKLFPLFCFTILSTNKQSRKRIQTHLVVYVLSFTCMVELAGTLSCILNYTFMCLVVGHGES